MLAVTVLKGGSLPVDVVAKPNDKVSFVIEKAGFEYAGYDVSYANPGLGYGRRIEDFDKTLGDLGVQPGASISVDSPQAAA